MVDVVEAVFFGGGVVGVVVSCGFGVSATRGFVFGFGFVGDGASVAGMGWGFVASS